MAQRGCAAPGCPSDAQFKRLWCGFHLNNPASRLISGRVTYLDVKNKTAFQERARQLITEMAGDVESTIQLVRDLVISDDPDFNSEQEIGKKKSQRKLERLRNCSQGKTMKKIFFYFLFFGLRSGTSV